MVIHRVGLGWGDVGMGQITGNGMGTEHIGIG